VSGPAALTLSGIECIRALRLALEHDAAPPRPVCERIIKAIRRVETADDDLTLDAALGISPGRWRKDCQRRRDELIRAARNRFLSDLSVRAAAIRVARIGRQLQAGRRGSMNDEATALVREALELGVPFPSSPRQIENILKGFRTK